MSEQRYGFRGYRPEGRQVLYQQGMMSAQEAEEYARETLSHLILGCFFDLIEWDLVQQDGKRIMVNERIIKRIGN